MAVGRRRHPLWRLQRWSGRCGLARQGTPALEKVTAGSTPALEKATASGNRAGEGEQRASDGERRDGRASWEISLSFFLEKP